MQMSFTKLYAPWRAALLLLLLSTNQLSAQQAMVRGGEAPRETGSIPLQQLLSDLEANYHVSFNYASSQIADKLVSAKSLRVAEGKLEPQLNKILSPLGLSAVKLSDHDFAIRPVTTIVKEATTVAVIVKGIVTDENNAPLPGVSVNEKGTTNGTATDADGHFSINVATNKSVLVFRSVGYQSKEVTANSSSLQIKLTSDVRSLDGVVVTALGIKRSEKALGYSIATLKGDAVSTVKEVNVVSALSGKVAGVNVRSASSDPGGSILVTIRGQSSLSSQNQPLYVVDGVPISSGNRSPKQNIGKKDAIVDYGSTLSDINPDDIASVSVLKGASASALYGSRALNGVILITTKSGSGAKKGLGVSVNSSAMFDKAALFPQFQNDFGSGDSEGSDDTDSQASWGPRLNTGRKLVQWDSPVDANGNKIATDWVAYPNRYKDFYRTGSTLINNVAVTGNNKDGSFRLSYTNLGNEGIVPNTNLKRNTLNLSASYQLHPQVKVSTNVGYAKNSSDNRPTFNRNSASNIIYTITPNVDVRKLRNYWMPGYEGIKQYQQNSKTDNPYFVAYEFTNAYNRDRLNGNVMLDYQITKDLSIMGRTGMDYYSELREGKRPFGAINYKTGGYSIETEMFREQNTDFLISYKKNVDPDWFVSVSAGANRMNQYGRSTSQASDNLVTRGLYNIVNAVPGTIQNASSIFQKRINSVYGMGQIAYRNYAFLDLTARNDWSSTLPIGSNSYFYPSASLSLILSDMFNVKSNTLSFAKVRGNFAQVGGDTDPYSLENTFGFGQDWNTIKRGIISGTLKNNVLKPLIGTSYEFGADVRFFQNRLGFDVTYYNTINKNQIINVKTTMASGYSDMVMNAGKIQNKGFEIALNATPVMGKFRWDATVNYTRNRNKVLKLAEGIPSLEFSKVEGVSMRVEEGGQMGDMYAQTWETIAEGEHKGEAIVNGNGEYNKVNALKKIGNYNPDFMVGFSNTFTYKNFALNMLIDWRQGGQFFSYVAKNLLSDGRTTITLPGRDAQTGGLPWGNGRNDGLIMPGYVEESPGKYVKNTEVIDPEAYYGNYYWDFLERSTFDATYVKLREVSLTYNFSKKTLGKLPVSNLSVSFIARNLFSWTAADAGYDPETSFSVANGALSQGVTSWGLPYTRSYGFKLGFNF
ncbi:SusC/RagA family TonB-linked outer membrane protein [Chitinophaga silvatica]|uniref:SusC/RagA family TonB-linked outer membrane protein n=1 Tax=Chitinophaga silvatica TaxID=2282649 RepID=A0A3E1Y900_9BACT|nr:SusC/RagA family TonB-linked outer membrane protein [Chitinophaga silvatica]RFS21929.1 SusC/RagA family TonB-linked outer membrane protein [Chitinophaga silvatica]